MGLHYNRKQFGLFDNGCFQDGTNRNFEAYNLYTLDSLSGNSCVGVVEYNSYGGGAFGNEYVEVDPINKHYQMSVSVKTIQPNYNGNNGSGHLGFACYDADFNSINHYQAFSTQNAKLTRSANPGDQIIYIDRGDWTNSSTSHIRSLNFYFPGSPYEIPGGYSRFGMHGNSGYALNGITQISSTEWEVVLDSVLPNFGYPYDVGVDVGRTYAGGSYNYALGAPIYPTEWTTYITPVMTGYVINGPSSSANFRDQTKYIKFLNLRNYNYRSENAGDSARYLLDNIILVECPNGQPWPNKLFKRNNVL